MSGIFYTNTIHHAFCCINDSKTRPPAYYSCGNPWYYSGSILFLVVALLIGIFNDMARMNISVCTNVAENIFSAILLFILVIACVGVFYGKVATTPPSEPEQEE